METTISLINAARASADQTKVAASTAFGQTGPGHTGAGPGQTGVRAAICQSHNVRLSPRIDSYNPHHAEGVTCDWACQTDSEPLKVSRLR